MKVAIAKGDEFGATTKALELIKEDIKKSLAEKNPKKILIKPNLVMTKKSEAGNANVDIVRALITFLNRLGRYEIIVGEGATLAFGQTTTAFKESGYLGLEKEFDNVRLHDFNQDLIGDYFDGQTLHGPIKIGLCKSLRDADYVISVAKLKTHNHALVTLSLKNFMGCINQSHRAAMHGGIDPGFVRLSDDVYKKEAVLLNHNLVRLAEACRPDLAIIDGVVAMEGEGPARGEPVKMGIVLASADPLSADLVAIEIMGLDPEKVAYLKILRDARKPAIEIAGEPLKNFKKKFALHSRAALQFVDPKDVERLLEKGC